MMNYFQSNIIAIYGEQGKAWLEALPSITQQLAEQWHITDMKPFENLSYNYVLMGKQEAYPVVLKVACAAQDIAQEMAALRDYQGHGAVKLLDVNYAYNALLLERALPGVSLRSKFPACDSQAVEIACAVMNQLHAQKVSDPSSFRTLESWVRALYTTKLVNYHVDKARVLAQELLKSMNKTVLLHGDLHHENIVSSARGWLAIDPKGVIGELAYEVGPFMLNPFQELLKQPDVKNIFKYRLDLFSELLKIDKERLKAWSYVQAVLSDCWSAEHFTDSSQWFAEADILDKL